MGHFQVRGAATAAFLLALLDAGPTTAQTPPPEGSVATYRVLGESADAPEPDAAGKFIIIKRGDTLAELAEDARVPLAAVTAENPGKNPRRLMPGDKIRLPERASGGLSVGIFECPGDPRC